MKTIKSQMAVADKIMKKLETFDPTCILAGGAPRDWYFGEVATDLDFFVYWRPDFALQMWRYTKQLEKLGFTNITRKLGEGMPANYKRNPHLIVVLEFEYLGESVQVMFMSKKTFESVVPLFPFGICQAWYKCPRKQEGVGYGKIEWGGVQVSSEFLWSVKHKTLRLINDLYNDKDGYVTKIKNKFPDYEFIK